MEFIDECQLLVGLDKTPLKLPSLVLVDTKKENRVHTRFFILDSYFGPFTFTLETGTYEPSSEELSTPFRRDTNKRVVVLKPFLAAGDLVVFPVGELLELHKTVKEGSPIPWEKWKSRTIIPSIDKSGFRGFRVAESRLFAIYSREGGGVCVNVFDFSAQLGAPVRTRGKAEPLGKHLYVHGSLGEMRYLRSTGQKLEFEQVNPDSLVDAGNGGNSVVFLWVSIYVFCSRGGVTKRDLLYCVKAGKSNRPQIVHMVVVNVP